MSEAVPAGTARELVDAAILLIGRHGYDGVSTRMLADAARTNVSSIRYHFGGKEELYLAALDHVLATMAPRIALVQALASQARMLAADDRARQAQLMRSVVHAVLDAFLGHPEVRMFLPVVLRELLLPGPHFEYIYHRAPRLLHETLTGLVAWIDGADPDDPRIIIRTHAVIGALIVFHIGRPILLQRLELDDLGEAERRCIGEEVTRLVLSALNLEMPDALAP